MAEMNQFVPDFHQVDFGSIPSSSGVCHFNEKNQNHEDDNNNYNDEQGLMEMMWSNGKAVQRSLNCQEQLGAPGWEQTAGMCSTSAFPASEPQLFMQEDEMASWLHYPIEEDGGTDLAFPATPPPADLVVRGDGGNAVDRIGEAEPPVSRPRMGGEVELSSNFSFFNPLGRMLSRGREPPAAEANAIGLGLGVQSDGGDLSSIAHPEAEQERNRGRDRVTYPFDITSMRASSSAAAAEKKKEENNVTADEKKKNKDAAVKRKMRLEDDEDDKSEATGRNKRARGSSSARRTRAAAVHNLSERKRRDRINEKMKALQELIPYCNKSDKASMLDDAIEYVKQLQRQIQILSVRNSAMPMVFPDGQAYLAPIGLGMGIGMGMPMPMPMPMPMQFPHLGGPSLPRPFEPPPLCPRLPIPAYLPPPTGASLGRSRMPADQPDPLLSHYGVRGLNAMAVPFPGPYPRYLGHYGFQPQPFPPPQARPTGEASTSTAGEPSTSKGGDGGDPKAQK